MSSRTKTGWWICVTLITLTLPACTSDGHISIGGYSSAPLYDNKVKTVYVPVFKSDSLRKGLEFDLTQAVIREIEAKTPYKVVSDCDKADSELIGTVRVASKQVLNRTQQNTIREGQTVLLVDVYWKDLRTGEILSAPREGRLAPAINRQLAEAPKLQPLPGPESPPPVIVDPVLADAPGTNLPPPATSVQSFGMYIPELGGSNATSWQQSVNRMAVKIVSLMEQPW